jgi:hypothetical protein
MIKAQRLPLRGAKLKPLVRIIPKSENFFADISELLGYIGSDKGHWNYSPEWYGSHGGVSWARDYGTTVFRSDKDCTITVTAHDTSLPSPPLSQWRVLRFNDTTRQSVALCNIYDDDNNNKVVADPSVLCFEYMKTIASITAALLGVNTHLLSLALPPTKTNIHHNGSSNYQMHQDRMQQQECLRILCVGLGGGSLPNFLNHHFPGALIDAIELDPIVAEAAHTAMGFPFLPTSNNNSNRKEEDRVRVFIMDAYDYAQQHAQKVAHQVSQYYYDLVFMDAFDGQDNIPAKLKSSEFAEYLSRVMHPQHGTLVMNVHSTDVGPIASLFKHEILLQMQGREGEEDDGPSSSLAGCCFSVQASKQPNTELVVARGIREETVQQQQQGWKEAAVHVADLAGFNFPVGRRAMKGLKLW